MHNRPNIAEVFFSFLKLGLVAFGGPAMVSYIRDLSVEKKKWLSGASFKDGVAICQSIPGATAMQAAAYAGLRAAGGPGAVAAFLGFGLPAFVLMVVLSVLYGRAHDLVAVVAAFKGLQVIVIALVANATLNFGRASLKKWQDFILAFGAAVFLIMRGSPVVVIFASAVFGLVIYPTAAELWHEGSGNSKKREKEILNNNNHNGGKVNTEVNKSDNGNSGAGNVYGTWRQNLATPFVLILLFVAVLSGLFLFDPKLFDLSLLMAKVDLFAFGGGYASVPLMLHEVVDARHWMNSRIFMDGIALGQVTPGPIVITATFVGYLIAGLPGAIVGTLSIFTPSLVILTAVVPYFDRVRKNIFFKKGLRGVLASFVGLLLAVTIQFSLAIHWHIYPVLICLAAFLALRLKVDILWVVIIGAALAALIL